jgi:uncharacterized membrane protein YedE/YeeE
VTRRPESVATQVVAAALGALFAIGLAISGMAAPGKVLGFLDATRGAWDPQLAFVMAGAIAACVAVRRFARRSTPLLAAEFSAPGHTAIDARLVGGAALFGVGWGLSGYCPGPALVSLSSTSALVFSGAMIAGIALARLSTGR